MPEGTCEHTDILRAMVALCEGDLGPVVSRGLPDADSTCHFEEERYNQRMETLAWESDD